MGDILTVDLALIRATGAGGAGLGRIKDTQEMAIDNAEAYEDTDERLARELTKHGSDSAASPGVKAS